MLYCCLDTRAYQSLEKRNSKISVPLFVYMRDSVSLLNSIIMNRSHALSEKAIKKMGLDKKSNENPLSKEVVKEWTTEQEYWDEW